MKCCVSVEANRFSHISNVLFYNITPFVIYKPHNNPILDAYKFSKNSFTGIDYNLLNTVSKHLNITLKYKLIKLVNNSRIHDEYNSDIIIGGLDSNMLYSNKFEPLVAHIYDDLYVCFQNPAHLPRWLYFFLVTDSNSYILWFYGMIDVFANAVLIFLYTELEKHHIGAFDLLLYGFGIVAGISVPYDKYSKKMSSRILFGTLLFCIFVVVSVYNAMFFDILMNQKYPPKIQNYNEAMRLNYTIVSPPEFKVSF